MNIPHPIAYQGSKRGLAERIIDYFPENVETLHEPFAGSAAVSLAASALGRAKHFHINDLNKPLIDLWKNIVNKPREIASQYEIYWNEQLRDPAKYYQNIRKKFNVTGRSDCFLYLLARCIKASIRYNSNGEFNQSPDNRRLGTRPITMRDNIVQASVLLKNRTTFSSKNFRDVLFKIAPNDLIYMDPPYQGVCGDRDTRYLGGIQFCEFVEALEKLNDRKVRFIVSYDGRTGRKTFGKYLPQHLDLTRIELCCGRSSQATLLGRSDETFESLYISPALNKEIIHRNIKSNLRPIGFQLDFAQHG